MNLRLVLTAASGQAKMQLDNMMKDAGNTLAKGAADSLSRVFKGVGGAGGRVGGVLNAFPLGGMAGAAVAGVGAVIGVLKMIHDGINKMIGKLGESSAAFRGSREMLDKMFNLALKPVADVMTALMRPYLMLIMRRIRAAMPEIRALMPGAAAGDEESIKRLTELTQGLMQDMAFITAKMNDIIMPIAGALDGFKRGIDVMFNNFLTGANASFEATITAISSNFRPMPKTLSTWIENETKASPQFFNDLPKNIAAAFKDAATSDEAMANLIGLPNNFYNAISTPLSGIAGALATANDWFNNKIRALTNAGQQQDWRTGGSPSTFKPFGPPGSYTNFDPKRDMGAMGVFY